MGKPPPAGSTTPALDGRTALAAGVAAFTVYLLTLYPDVAGGDSGELIAASASGGVIHPPGYPLYSLLGGAFAHLPFGSLAWRFNLFSTLCDASATGVLFLAVARWSGSRWAGLLSAALFAWAPVVWQYATCAEVFPLNNLFVAVLLLFTVLYGERLERRWALAGAFTLGLGLSNHQTLLFAGLPMAAWVLWIGRRDLLKPRPLIELVALCLAGLLPYLALPFVAARHAPVTWGATDTWDGFWRHLLRREYGTLRLAAPDAPGTVYESPLTAWMAHLPAQLGVWGLALAAVGLVVSFRGACRRTSNPFGLISFVPVLGSVAVMVALGRLPAEDPLSRTILARFWQQPDIFLFAWCGLGAVELARRVRSVPLAAITVVVAALQLTIHWQAQDHHRSRAMHDYDAEILRVAPPHAILLTRGDAIVNGLRYLQLAEKSRPDVLVLDEYILGTRWAVPMLRQQAPDVVFPGLWFAPVPGGFSARQFLDANIDRRPVVVCGGIIEEDHSADEAYEKWPLGRCSAMRRRGDPPDVDAWSAASDAALPRIDWSAEPHAPGTWEGVFWNEYWEARNDRAAKLIDIVRGRPDAIRYVQEAVTLLERVTAEDSSPPASVWKNLALGYGTLGLETPEQRHRTADAWSRYLRVAPRTDPDLPRIPGEILRLSQ